MREDQTPDEVCSRILTSLSPILEETRPDLMLIQGDTTTAMAGANGHLSRHWRRFTDEPLPAFVAGVHLDLATQRSQLPRSAQRFAARLIDRGILLGYHRTANVHRALAFIGLRLHQPQLADAGVAHWLASYDQIDDNFAAFFPELAEYARTERAALQANLA